MSRSLAAAASLALCVLAPAAVCGAQEAQAVCPTGCDGDAPCALSAARCWIDAGDPRQALDELKPAHGAYPGDGNLVRAMAAAYLTQGNTGWAVKRLLEQLDVAPDDLETRTWTVWVLLLQGDVPRAAAVLDAAGTVPAGPLAERVDLLRATLADLDGDPEGAEQALRAVMQRRGSIWPEDKALLSDLRWRIRDDGGSPISARIQLSGGYTSNAIQSAPEDPGAAGEAPTGAPLVVTDAVVRLEPWTSPHVRPAGEVRLKAVGPLSEAGFDFAYLDLGGRVGVDLGRGDIHVFMGYSGELMAVHGGDAYREPGPRVFMEAHRAEFEATLSLVQVFVGAGRRIYRELPRTRTELDGGVAAVIELGRGTSLTPVVAGRIQDARHEGWDGRGLTGLVRLTVPLPAGAMIKLKGLVVWDHYPDSAAYYGADEPRSDVLGKVEIGPWSPVFGGGHRLGLTYALAHRSSSLEDYRYTDHRILLELRLEGGWDPRSPRTAAASDEHWTLPYGLGAQAGGGLDRVQDLLRQEDSARRGSSCVD